MELFLKFIVVVAFIFLGIKIIKEIGRWNPPVSENNEYGNQGKHGAGIGGWLLFLVFSLIFTAPISSVVVLSISLEQIEQVRPNLIANSFWLAAKGVVWLFTIASAGLSICAARELLIKRNKYVVPKVIKLIWISGPILTLLLISLIWISSNLFMPEFVISSKIVIGMFRDFFQGVITSIGWTLYLRMSRRVKNTYGY